MTIKELVSQLTLQEKAKLAGGADAWHTAAIERLGIPEITVPIGTHSLGPGIGLEIASLRLGPAGETLAARSALVVPLAVGLSAARAEEPEKAFITLLAQ